MSKFKFKDGSVVTASTAEEAKKLHKTQAAFPFEKKSDKAVEEYLLVPTDKIINKGWLLRYKKLLILSDNTVGIKNGMRKEKLARTIQKMNKLIHDDV